MKDTEFLELLNLYLDHEISAADSARLESEVQGDSDRRRTYLEYCRMQKACTLLAKDFASEPAERKIIAFEPSRPAWANGALATGGLLAAAACVALVLMNRAPQTINVAAPSPVAAMETPAASAQSTAIAAPTATQATAPAAEKLPASVIARAVTMPVHHAEAKPLIATVPLGQIVANPDAAAMLAAAQKNMQAQLDWMKTMQLAPMETPTPGQLRVDPRSSLQPASRTYTGNRPTDGTVQWTAFKFQK